MTDHVDPILTMKALRSFMEVKHPTYDLSDLDTAIAVVTEQQESTIAEYQALVNYDQTPLVGKARNRAWEALHAARQRRRDAFLVPGAPR